MKPKLYLETSIISYLAARPSRDIVIAGHQASTRDWWDNHRDRYDLFVSETVYDEASAGDSELAAERLALISEIPLLGINEKIGDLVDKLIENGPLPEKARVDAVHLATAIFHQMDYLLTWNCKHIANPAFFHKIEQVCDTMGYGDLLIYTPNALLEA